MGRIYLILAALLAALSGCGATRGALIGTGITADSILTLAEDGRTKYSIVIAAEAKNGEKFAADELAYFLRRMTGADFPIRHDSEPAGEFEIVVGHTNRKRLEDLPAELRTDNMEGFAIVPEGGRLIIIGNIPRGTVYGVFDFLDLDLGVRFLDDHVNHVPRRETLKVPVSSRMYEPPIERRTIYQTLFGTATVRNRMNGHGFQVANERDLGGVKWVGRPTHTMDILVPREKYFKTHPEYFPLVDGERREVYDGIITQVCLTNPDVILLCMNQIREWMKTELDANPYNKVVASVSVNDSSAFCQCEPCLAVKREDGSEDDAGAGAAHLRLVNAIARRVAEEFPGASISTMLYHSAMPRTIKPEKNVIMQMVSGIDWRYKLDDPNSPDNVHMSKSLANWKKKVGDGKIYNWSKHVNFGNFFHPSPNIRNTAHNLRVYHEKYALGGVFAQNQQSRGTEMQALRFYVLARAMWRPTVDSRETIKEFCRAYYGKGGEGVLKYVNYLHDEWTERLPQHGAVEAEFLGRWDLTPQEIHKLTSEGEAILSKAEAAADTLQTKHRVAVCRLPMWHAMLVPAFGSVGNVATLPDKWHFRFDAEKPEAEVGLKQQWQKTTDFSDWRMMRTDRHWTFQDESRRGTAWYGIHFDLPDTRGAPLGCFFESIDGDADVFIDGVKIGEQKLPATVMWNHGFYLAITDGLAPGRHTMVIRVHKPNHNAGIWKPISIVDMSVPLSAELRGAAERFIDVARAEGVAYMSESYFGRDTQTELVHYPKIRFFLRHGIPLDKTGPWIRTDAHLAAVRNPSRVTELVLSGAQMTDAGLQPLLAMTNLRRLEMRMLRGVTAEGAAAISGLEKLKHLDLWQTKIGDEGLKHLQGLKNLETLDLTETGISDAGLASLSGLGKLKKLNIGWNRISDEGLKHLSGLTRLRVLYVDDDQIIGGRTEKLSDGALALMRAIPGLQIKRNDRADPPLASD